MTAYAKGITRHRRKPREARVSGLRSVQTAGRPSGEREEFEAWVDATLDRGAVSRDAIELCFDSWVAGRRLLSDPQSPCFEESDD